MIFYRRLQPVQAITFDLDDTLYDNRPVLQRAESEVMQIMLQHYPATQSREAAFWQQCKRHVLAANPALYHDVSLMRQTALRYGLAQCGIQGEKLDKAVIHLYQEFVQRRSAINVCDTVKSTLAELAKRVPLLAITNGNVNLQTVGLAEFFQTSFHANLIQRAKPCKDMFQLAAEYLQLPTQHILHVGDNAHTDVAGGLDAGFQTAWYAHADDVLFHEQATRTLPHVQLKTLSDLLKLV